MSPVSEDDPTLKLLSVLRGGPELLEWFGGVPNFHDAEIHSLHLNRKAPSELIVEISRGDARAIVTFNLKDWIDVDIRGFSRQNVIEALRLRTAGERRIEPWERGVGVAPGELEIELLPIFGAYGVIRATVMNVRLRVL